MVKRLPLNLLVAALLLSTTGISAAEPADAPLKPAEAIAAVDRSARGAKARFEMVVASAKKRGRITFLDSDVEYRAEGNVTFSLAPIVASKLKDRFGAPPEQYLLGKRVVVHGIMQKRPVLNLLNGAPRSFNRFAYGVEIRELAQIELID